MNSTKEDPLSALLTLPHSKARIGQRCRPYFRRFCSLIMEVGQVFTSFAIHQEATSASNFYGLWDKEYFDLDAEYRNMRDRWPTRLISVAIDDCGNRFCLSVEPPDFGSVYFWDHEEEVEEGDQPTELNLYHVADSFVEFWNRMEPINPDEYLAEADSPIDAESQQPSSDVPPQLPTARRLERMGGGPFLENRGECKHDWILE